MLVKHFMPRKGRLQGPRAFGVLSSCYPLLAPDFRAISSIIQMAFTQFQVKTLYYF